MFTLTRRAGESVALPALNVTVRVLEVRGDTVRLGVEVPPGVHIARSEVLGRLALSLARHGLAQAPGDPAGAGPVQTLDQGT